MKWLNWLGAAPPDEDALEERLRQLPRWPGDRLAPLLVACGSDPPARAAAAADEIRGALKSIWPEWLITLDRVVRHELLRAPYRIPEWVKTPGAVEHLRRRVGDDVAVLCVLSMSPSGYVREAAIERIAQVGTGRVEFPFLVLRSYDWVEPVRLRAEKAAIDRVTPDKLSRVVESLGLLLHCEVRGRRTELARRAVELLRDPSARDYLRQGMRGGDALARLFCFRQLMEDESGQLELVMKVLASGDLVLRREAARMSAGLPLPVRAAVAPMLLRHRAAHLRVDGVLIAATLGDEMRPLLRTAAADPDATVRRRARQALKERGEIVDAAWYRAELAANPKSRGALAGLAEMGTGEDADLFERYLNAPRVRLRVIAVQEHARVRKGDAVPVLTRMVADPSPRVSRAAANALLALRVAPAELAELYESGASHVRRHALPLLVRRGKWDGLAWTLRACADSDPRIAEIGRGLLARWLLRFNRTYAEPAPGQVTRVKQALRDAAAVVPPEDWKRLMEMVPAPMRTTGTNAGTAQEGV